MSELNEITKERIAEKVLKAMDAEKLTTVEAGKIMDINPQYLSMIKRIDKYNDKIPAKAWTVMRAWYYSGTELRDFKISDQAKEFIATIKEDPHPKDTKTGDLSAVKTERQSITKTEAVITDLRSKDDMIKIKRSPADVNRRTGALVTIEIFEDGVYLRINR